MTQPHHVSRYPLTATATGVVLGVAGALLCLAVLWLAVAVGARLAVGMGLAG